MTIKDLPTLVTDSFEIENEIKLLEAKHSELRQQIHAIVDAHGKPVAIEGVAILMIVGESKSSSYHAESITEVINDMNDAIRKFYNDGVVDDVRIAQELSKWAERLLSTVRISTRKPTLRITKAKVK